MDDNFEVFLKINICLFSWKL